VKKRESYKKIEKHAMGRMCCHTNWSGKPHARAI